MSDFTQNLAQMISSARPQIRPGNSPQYLGMIQSRSTHGPDWSAIGTSLGRAGEAIKQYRAEQDRRTIEFVNIVRSYQGSDKDAWNSIKASPQIQEKMRKYAQGYPELFYQDQASGLWEVMPSSAAEQAHRKGEAEAGTAEAEQRQRAEQAKAEPYETRRKAASAGIEELRQRILKASVPAEEQKSQAELEALRAGTTATRGREEREKLAAPGQRALTGAQVGHLVGTEARAGAESAADIALKRSQETLNVIEAEQAPAKAAAENAQREASAARDRAATQKILTEILTETAEKSMSAQTPGLMDPKVAKEVNDTRRDTFAKLLTSYKDKSIGFEAEIACKNADDTLAMGTSLGSAPVVLSDSEGQFAVAMPGLVAEPFGRFWVSQSMAMLHNAFEMAWSKGDLDQLVQIRDKMAELWGKSWRQVPPIAASHFKKVPEGATYDPPDELYRELVDVVYHVDLLTPPEDPSKLKSKVVNGVEEEPDIYKHFQSLGLAERQIPMVSPGFARRRRPIPSYKTVPKARRKIE